MTKSTLRYLLACSFHALPPTQTSPPSRARGPACRTRSRAWCGRPEWLGDCLAEPTPDPRDPSQKGRAGEDRGARGWSSGWTVRGIPGPSTPWLHEAPFLSSPPAPRAPHLQNPDSTSTSALHVTRRGPSLSAPCQARPVKGWGQLPLGLASPHQVPTGLRGSPAWPWPDTKSPEAQGRGQEGGGRYHPERQLLALIYFCFKCWRIAGLEPPARGARAAAGRRGSWAGGGGCRAPP